MLWHAVFVCRGWSQLPVYNFVNGMDIVPRLLGDTSIHVIAEVSQQRV